MSQVLLYQQTLQVVSKVKTGQEVKARKKLEEIISSRLSREVLTYPKTTRTLTKTEKHMHTYT